MTAIQLLKTTTEYEVLQSFRDKVSILEEEVSRSDEDLECAWNSSEQNMRSTFSSSAYKKITFKQWLDKFKQEK